MVTPGREDAAINDNGDEAAMYPATPGECLTLGGHDGSPCSRCGRERPDRPRPASLPRPSPCEDCGGRLSTTPGVIHTIQHAEDCWKHQYNACPDCRRNHRDAEDCVFHGRRFDPDAPELVQVAQMALEHAMKARQPGLVNAHLTWGSLEAHLTVLIDELPDALDNGQHIAPADPDGNGSQAPNGDRR